MKRILILCGGQSPEHPISIRSCKNILAAIDREKFSTTVIGISREGSWRLMNEDELDKEITIQGAAVEIRPGVKDCFWSHGQSLGVFDAVFPILHGPNGEDGTIQGLLRLLNLPFVGPDVLGSAASMDKDVTKRLLRDAGIRVAQWKTLRKGDAQASYRQLSEELGEVFFVKPANMGSSVGVHRVASDVEWENAIKDAFSYDTKVLVERFVKGRELECAVLGNESPQATGVGEVKSGEFYSYEEKYDDASQAEIIIPAQINERNLPKLKETAIKAYKTLECKGLSRVDMFLTEEGEVFVNEVNTIPGFTNISMYPKLWEQEGLSYSALIEELIELAMEKR